MLAIVVLFIDTLLWASFLPNPPPLRVPFKLPNLINGIGLIAPIGLLISILARNNWLRKVSGIILIVMHMVLIGIAYVLTKYDRFEVAYLIAGISILAITITAAMFFWPPIVAFFRHRADA
jgi:uncharacterized membrane protein